MMYHDLLLFLNFQLTHMTLFVFAMKGFVKNILNFPMMEPEIAVMAENVSKIP